MAKLKSLNQKDSFNLFFPMNHSRYIKKNKNRLILDHLAGDDLAIINYDRGNWIIQSSSEIEVKINGVVIHKEHILQKEDIIDIEGSKLYWKNYFEEGHHQKIFLQDFTTINGRVNKSNYRGFTFLLFCLIPCVYLSPGLIANLLSYRKIRMDSTTAIYDLANYLSIPIWTIFGILIFILFLIISIKRMRDAGYPLWYLLIPIKNIQILFFKKR